jgi:hypothetical protein
VLGAGSPVGQPGEQGSGSGPLLSTYTTSWVRFLNGAAGAGRGYYAQPSACVYFADTDNQAYPEPVAALISSLAAPSSPPGAAPCFPLVPYGGIYATYVASPMWQANTAQPQVFVTIEALALSTARHGAIPVDAAGPRFLAEHSGSSPTPLLGNAATPQGLLVDLNSDGSWQRLTLALSPDTAWPNGPVSFSGPQTVDPHFSTALLQNELFLVVSSPVHLGEFQKQIGIGGFNFTFDVGGQGETSPNEVRTILVFKFNSAQSLAHLVAQPQLWASTDKFIGEAAQVTAVQEMLLSAIQIAAEQDGPPGYPFDFFNLIANQPDWTGVLAFNCAIDGNGMPPDLQMLLGGVHGQLRAHHVGVQLNKLQRGATPDRQQIIQSSIFGVIHYNNEDLAASAAGDVDYEVETLTVVFNNSKITQFNVKVGLTLNRILGRQSSLIASPPNTLVIAGQYQVKDGIGTVTFVSKDPFVVTFPTSDGQTRVIEEVLITNATLVPVSSTRNSPDTVVVAAFGLAGQMMFAPQPFPGSDGLDLFSYGAPGSPDKTSTIGLPFIALTVKIEFMLDEFGEQKPNSKTVAYDLAPLRFNPTSKAIRPGSLLYSLPLKYAGFNYGTADAGLTASSLGAQPIHCLELQGGKALIEPPPSPPSSPPATITRPPYTTASPLYALQFEMPLGSLGSLSNVHAGLVAQLYLAWGPSTMVPENDGAAVLVQLPQAMAGYKGFNLQGILKTTFGDGNLLKVDLPNENGVGTFPVYAILFNNVALSIFGYTFPPGLVVDFLLFAGQPATGASTNTSNLAWYLSAMQK